MYRDNHEQLEFVDFYLPFTGKLSSSNRWVKQAQIVPWDYADTLYLKNLSNSKEGGCGLNSRIALGSLLIQAQLNLTDRETVDQIFENPYLQYFIGLREFTQEKVFDASLMVHFRKRLPQESLNLINEEMIRRSKSKKPQSSDGANDNDHNPTTDEMPSAKGQLIVDATCAPSDIAYPTDLKLLNQAREKCEKIIDKLHEAHKGKIIKPRTDRNQARKRYLSVAKKKRPGHKKIRKAIGQQLGYLKRDLKIIDSLSQLSGLSALSKSSYRELLVISELYRQQTIMYEQKTHTIADRIVSISQPHIRPIVRGKTNANVEFGAKVSISIVDGFAYADRISWDNYNESTDLQEQIMSFLTKQGCYPESVHADKIYRTQENLKYCKQLGIRLSGPALGRPKQDPATLKTVKKQQKNMTRVSATQWKENLGNVKEDLDSEEL